MEKASEVLKNMVVVCEYYYNLVTEVPPFSAYQEFLGQLPDYLRSHFLRKGYKASCKSPFFKRYLLEATGWDMHDFMRSMLSESAYLIWCRQDEEANNLFIQQLQHQQATKAVY